MSNKIIDDLIVCGVPGDTLVAVVKLIAEAEIIERKRIKTRERVQRFRDRKRSVTLHSVTETLQNVTEALPLPLDGPPDRVNAAMSASALKKKNRDRGSRLPSDWQPKDHHFEEGCRLNLTSEQVSSFAEDMRLWAAANAHRPIAHKLDWDKTFSGWLRRQKPGQAPPPADESPEAKYARSHPGWRPGMPTDEEIRKKYNGTKSI